MNWHIITSSKGGVGKTLMTFLVLGYLLEKKPDEGILVIDLNGMNTDSAALLSYQKKRGEAFIDFPTQQVNLVKTFSQNADNTPNYYLLGQPVNPFKLHRPETFAVFLAGIKNKVSVIERLGSLPLHHVIIDTNYHFCNLFEERLDHEAYKIYKSGSLKEEQINLWFLWTYRQLYKLNREGPTNEAMTVRMTAQTIEHHLTNRDGQGPFIHTFSPVALESIQDVEEDRGFLSDLANKFVTAWQQKQDFVFDKLKKMEKWSLGEYVGFETWQDKLGSALNTLADTRPKDNPHLLLMDAIEEAVRLVNRENQIAEEVRPTNIMPLAIYQHGLRGYTDKERYDPIANLRKLKIYNNFARLMEGKRL